MEATEIDRELSAVPIQSSTKHSDVAPIIIVLGLYRCRNSGRIPTTEAVNKALLALSDSRRVSP